MNGKHILLTNIWLCDFGGSELNCLNLAKELTRQGASVEVATLMYGKPVSDEFERFHVDVKVISNETLSRNHYDIIWAHHTVVLDRLLFIDGISADKIIFCALSPIEPYEAPPIYPKHLTYLLAVSEETKDRIIFERGADNITKHFVFPNYADNNWFAVKKESHNEKPQKIAIVSNHLPDELLEVKKMMSDNGVSVDIFGLGHKVELITSDLLYEYDLVITIGKTVQFALSQQIPVFCYDRYGGPGYLSRSNFDKCLYYIFSGRGFSQKTPQEIFTEIMMDYTDAVAECKLLFDKVQSLFDLGRNIETVLDCVEHEKTIDMDSLIAEYRYIERYSRLFLRLFGERNDLISTVSSLNDVVNRQNLTIDKNANTILELKEQYRLITNSKSWKITKPLRKIIKTMKSQ